MTLTETAEQLELRLKIFRENLDWEWKPEDEVHWREKYECSPLKLHHTNQIRIKTRPEAPKTLGQVAYESWHHGTDFKWPHDALQERWELAAQAVIAEHEKRKAAEVAKAPQTAPESPQTYRDLVPGVDVWQEGDEGTDNGKDWFTVEVTNKSLIGQVFQGRGKGRRPITPEPASQPEWLPCSKPKGGKLG